MREIFKSLIGMTLIVGLFFVFSALIDFYAPQLGPIASTVKGFVFVTLLMGIIIISKSAIRLIKWPCFKT